MRGEADGFLALDEYSRPFHTFLAASLLKEAVMGNILVVPIYRNAITQYLAVSTHVSAQKGYYLRAGDTKYTYL